MMYTYQDFLEEYSTSVLPHKPKEIRNGQYLMNFLRLMRKDLYDAVVAEAFDGKEVDCFYRDDLMPFTFKYLEKHWNDN